MLISRQSGKQRNRTQMDAINTSYGNIFSQSDWLDIVCPDWELLWDSQFRNFLAVPVFKKLNLFKAIQQPFFTQQLGLVGPDAGNVELQKAFLSKLLKHYPLGIYHFHSGNLLEDYRLNSRTNLILSLQNYEPNQADAHHRRNIKKGAKHGLHLKEVAPEALLKFFFQYNPQIEDFSKTLINQGHSIVRLLVQNSSFLSFAAVDGAGTMQSCLGIGLFRNRAYCLFNTSTLDARKIGAGHWLFAEVFMVLKNQGVEIFDFEGSEIPGVAKFFEGFGATEQPYSAIKWGNWFWKMAEMYKNYELRKP